MTRTVVRILATLSLAFLLLASVVSYLNPANGYEESIYESTPAIVWISVVIVFIGSISVIGLEILVERTRRTRFWVVGALILVLNHLLLVLMPFVRGYYTLQGDHITNIGGVIDIVMNGHIPTDNFYPITHLLLACTVTMSDIGIVHLSNVATGFLTIGFAFWTYAISRRLFGCSIGILSFTAAICITFNTYSIFLMPNGWSIMYLPLVVYVMLRLKDSHSWRIVLLIVVMSYPFFHPLSAIYLAILFGACGMILVLSRRTSTSEFGLSDGFARSHHNAMFAALLLVVLIPWLLSFQDFEPNITLLYRSILTGSSPNVIEDMVSQMSILSVDTYGLLALVVKTMGDDLIFVSLSLLAALRFYKTRRQQSWPKIFVVLLLMTLGTGIVYGAYIFNAIPGLAYIAADRSLSYLVVFSPVVGVSVFLRRGSKSEPRKIFTAVACGLILSSATISTFSLFPSPYISTPNPQTTHMDAEAYEWLFETTDDGIPFSSILMSPRRIGNLVIGTTAWNENPRGYAAPPDHFGLLNMSEFRDWLANDIYLVTSKKDWTTYEGVWREVGRYSSVDFVSIGDNFDFQRICSTGECDIWFLYGGH